MAASAAQVRSAERRKCERENAQRMQTRSRSRMDVRYWFAFSLVFLASLVTAGSSGVASTELASMASGAGLTRFNLYGQGSSTDAQNFIAGPTFSAEQLPSPASQISATPSLLSKSRTSTPHSVAAQTPVATTRSPAASDASDTLHTSVSHERIAGARMRSNILRSASPVAVSPSPRPPTLSAVIMHLQRSNSRSGSSNSTTSNQGDDDIF